MMCVYMPNYKIIDIMKKVILMAIAAMFAAATVSAQDMAQATETYNNGAMALQMGDNTGALNNFQQALTMAEACGEEGKDIVSNCKDIIPQLMLQIGKDKIKAEDYDGAIAQFESTIAKAKEYGKSDIETEARDFIPQVMMQKANTLLNDKKFAEAAEAYKAIVAGDPTNGTAFLRLGQAYGATGNIEDAEAAYLEAAKNGQEKNANKQLSNLFVKRAAAQLKAKKYDEAIADALKSNGYLENATAMKVAGTAASSKEDGANAIKYLEEYLRLSPNAKDANSMHYTIAVLAQKAGDKTKAIENYKKILSDPKFAETAKQQLAALGQ